MIDTLSEAPSTVSALGALALFVIWAADQAGYPVTHWAPGGLIVLALLVLTFTIIRPRMPAIALPTRIALACLAGYTALSFLSILWAAAPGVAWEGANRTLLYLLVFALFSSFALRGRSALLLLGVWTLAMVGLATFVLLHLDTVTNASLQSLLPYGRLDYPSGYANANAAQWLMAFWPAVLLARSADLPSGLRGALAGGAVLLAEVALLSQSRGSLYATPVMLVLVFAFLPSRTRTFLVLIPVAAGIGVAAPSVLRVGERLEHGQSATGAVHTATTAMFLAAVVVALLVTLGAALERRIALSESSVALIRKGVGVLSVATLVAILAGAWVAVGDPVGHISHDWDTFKDGTAEESPSGSRLISGLGSSRYDVYRVALDEFVAHPLVGLGADNFQQQYLVHGRSTETPRYPHSVELRTLAETGLLGALLAVIGLAAALWAGARAIRPPLDAKRADRLAPQVAAAALAGFGYWVVHGSFDWFWELAGLGAPAFALLGLGCALAPAAPPHDGRTKSWYRLSPAGRRIAIAGAVVMTLVGAASFAAPWLSQLEIERAARIWTSSPQTAYAHLKEAARLNPLSDEADLVAGSIALRLDDLTLGDREFRLALGRSPDESYATLERGAIASTKGERPRALVLLERAVRLNPRDALSRQALTMVQHHGRVNVEELNRAILLEAQRFA
jgi:tetratricopeptide (TPR) repeat protein